MSWVAAAVIGGSTILNYMGSQNAADAQANAANQANGTQWAMYNQNRLDNAPWRQAGGSAINRLSMLMGFDPTGTGTAGTPAVAGTAGYWTGGGQGHYTHGNDWVEGGGGQGSWVPGTPGTDAIPGTPAYNTTDPGFGSLSQKFNMSDFTQDPGYQFRLAEGQKALDRSAASKGMNLSGAQLKASQSYGQNMGSQEYGNAYNRFNNDQSTLYNRLAGISGIGQTANGQTQMSGMNAANNVAQNQLGAGNAAAAGIMGGVNAISNGVNQGINWNNSKNMWNSLSGADAMPTQQYFGSTLNSGDTAAALGRNPAWGG